MQHTSKCTLATKLQAKRALNQLCYSAVVRQLSQSSTELEHLRNRRRFLAKQVMKRIPKIALSSPKKLLHAAMMVLAMWGFNTLPAQQAEAAPAFKRFMLNGIGTFRLTQPSLVDIDNDGDLDAFVGEMKGTIAFYRNSGSASIPNFEADIAGNPLAVANISSTVGLSSPSFGDIDGDGDIDAFVGSRTGLINFYRNVGTATVPNFVADPINNPLAGFRVARGSRPKLIDIDHDGDLDVFVGVQMGSGGIKFYRNIGTVVAPNFVPDIANNPLASVRFSRYTSLGFSDIDGDGDFDAFISLSNASPTTVLFYRNTGTPYMPNFVPDALNNPLSSIQEGSAAPSFNDIDNDGDLDVFIGEVFGTVKFLRNTGSTTYPQFISVPGPNPLALVNVATRPNSRSAYATPVLADIDGDGDVDAFVGNASGGVKFYRNTGLATNANFVADSTGNPLSGVNLYSYTYPSFADIDNDGDLDAFVGGYYGYIHFYRNNGTPTMPNFVPDRAANPLKGVSANYRAAPSFVDIDHDGDLDAFVGDYSGVVNFYRNIGSASSPNFISVRVGNPLARVNRSWLTRTATPAFVDIDHDGDFDVFIGGFNGRLTFYRNIGTATVANFVADIATNALANFRVAFNSAPAFADIDADGDQDLFVGNQNGRVQFFANADPSPTAIPDSLISGSGIPTVSTSVIANDRFKTEGPAGSFTITSFSQGGHGSVAYNGNNTFTYTPTPGYVGVDVFSYTLSNGAGDFAVGTVNVTVTPNHPPIPSAPTIMTNEDTAGASIVSANDPDANDTHTFAVSTLPTIGTASVSAFGTLNYIPNANMNGSDSLIVTVTDIAGATGAVIVHVVVNAVNDPPTASSASIVTTEDTPSTPLTPSVTDVDIVTNGDTHTFAIISQPANGIASVIANQVVYTPNLNLNGADTFTYSATDLAGASVTGVATVSVTPVNDPPVITVNGSSAMTLAVGSTYIDLGAVATDVEDGNISANIVVSNTVNTMTAGTYLITYDVTDSGGLMAVQKTRAVTIQPVAIVPNQPLAGGVTASLQVPTGQSLANVSTAPVANTLPGVSFTQGAIAYTATVPIGGTKVTTSITLSGSLPAGTVMYKYDGINLTPIPQAATGSPVGTNEWRQTGLNSFSLTLTDGGIFDLDGIVNGLVVDPVAIGVLRTPAQVAAIPPAQIAALSPAQLATLTPAQIAALTATQVATITPMQMTGLTAAHIAALMPVQLGFLLPSLSATQTVALTATQISGLTALQLGALLPSLTGTQMTGLTAVQVATLTIAQVVALTPVQTAALTPTQVAALTPVQLGAVLPLLSVIQTAGITVAQIAALNPVQFAILMPAQIASLSPIQLAAMTVQQLVSLAPVQIAALSPTQVATLSVLQLATVFGQLAPSQQGLLTKAQLTSLRVEKIEPSNEEHSENDSGDSEADEDEEHE